MAIYGLAVGSQRRVSTAILGMVNVVFDIFAFAGFVPFVSCVVIACLFFLLLLAARSNVGQQISHQNYEDASPHLWIISAGFGRHVVNVDQICC